jgi:hypothetical protein
MALVKRMNNENEKPIYNDPASLEQLIDLASGRLSPEESLTIFHEIGSNEVASCRLETIIDLMQLASERTENIFEGDKSGRVSLWRLLLWRIEELVGMHPVLSPLASLTIFFMGFVCVFAYSYFERNKYEELIGIGRTAFEWNVRGQHDEDLASSYNSFSLGNYSQATLRLARYLKTHPESESTWYVHYCLGSVYLLSSRTSHLSLITTYDAAKVRSGLTELERAALGTNNLRLKEESRLLRSKGYLILGLADSAITELELVHRLDGQRKSEALQMIDRIRFITGGAQ